MQYMGVVSSVYPFLFRWLWQPLYFILLSSSNREYESLAIVWGWAIKQWYCVLLYSYSLGINNICRCFLTFHRCVSFTWCLCISNVLHIHPYHDWNAQGHVWWIRDGMTWNKIFGHYNASIYSWRDWPKAWCDILSAYNYRLGTTFTPEFFHHVCLIDDWKKNLNWNVCY